MFQKFYPSFLCFHVALVSSRLLHLYVCRSPYVCTDVTSCESPANEFKLYGPNKRTYCGFALNSPKICCLLSTQNETTTAATTPNAPFARVLRRNEDLLTNHRNFDLLPLDKCGVISNRLRITSGAKTSPGEFPWMALIAYRTGNYTTEQDFKCGGTLINEKYVLTAAHCIDNQTLLGVRLGEFNIMTDIDCDSSGQNCEPPVQDTRIFKTIIHPSYDPSTFVNDIGLIKLETAANYSHENIRPICLPFGELLELDLDDKQLTVAGWGATEQGGRSMTLRKVLVPVVPIPSCRKLYESLKPITGKQICAGADKGRDSCAGDSGGPLKRLDLINDNPRYVQYGIVSFGPSKCGLSTRPGIYTNVQRYMKWILDNLEA